MSEDNEQTIRRGIHSARWLINNAHNVGVPEWASLVAAAEADLDAAEAALDRQEAVDE